MASRKVEIEVLGSARSTRTERMSLPTWADPEQTRLHNSVCYCYLYKGNQCVIK